MNSVKFHRQIKLPIRQKFNAIQVKKTVKASKFLMKILYILILGQIDQFKYNPWLSSKEPACNAGDTETRVQSLGWEDSLGRKWQPTPVFLPGKSPGPRNLVGYSPWDHRRVGHNLGTTRTSIEEHTMMGIMSLY